MGQPSSDLASHVLVVDDDSAVGTVMGAQIRQAGYPTTVVTSGEAALAALEDTPFAVVISDQIGRAHV